jgi:hypothetical protein
MKTRRSGQVDCTPCGFIPLQKEVACNVFVSGSTSIGIVISRPRAGPGDRARVQASQYIWCLLHRNGATHRQKSLQLLQVRSSSARNRASASLAPPTDMLLRSTFEKMSLDGIFSWIYLSN